MVITSVVETALATHQRAHIKPLGAGAIAFWVLFTVIWAVQTARFRSFWEASPTFASFSPQAKPIQLNFKRQAPAAFVVGAFVIPLGWLIILFPNVGWVIAPVLILALLSLVGFVILTTVWLFNRPRRLVPPNLRDLPGLLSKPR